MGWEHAGFYSLTLNNSTFTNWAAGGNNAFSILGIVKQRAIHRNKHFTWFNLLEANFGVSDQVTGRIKTDDRIEFTTRLDRDLNKHWSASLFGNFRSQFADGFKNPEDTVIISTWMAPGYLTVGLGFTYKPDEHLTVYLSPITSKTTFVLDQFLADNGEFGVTPAVRDTNGVILTEGENVRYELGAYVDVMYTKKLTETLGVSSKLNLFSNYLDRPQNIDVNWENLITLEAWKFLKVSFLFHIIYDHDINVINPDATTGLATAPSTQIKTITGVSLAYSFGSW